MDLNGSTDSYPEIELAGKVVSDIESKVELNLNPNYYASYELFATIPGASNLKVSIFDPNPNPNPNPSPNPNPKVSIFDADRVGARDFIGATSIDLENRWFNSEWRDMELKPVEMRTLRTPLSKMSQVRPPPHLPHISPASPLHLRHISPVSPQGKVELWVEMMTPEEARQVPTRYRGDIGEI